jgi:hypothetical protein
MTGHIFVDIGLYLLAVTALIIVYKIVLIVAIYTIKKRFEISFIDNDGIKQSRILNIDNDEELDRLINEIKAKVAKHENI